MSYILDALRRAERERERGQVPGLSAQVAPVVTATAQQRSGPVVHALVLALALGLAGGLAWWLWSRASASVPLPVGRTAAPADAPAGDMLLPPAVAPAPPLPAVPAPEPVPPSMPTPLPVVVSAPRPPPPLPAPVVAPASPAQAASPDLRATPPVRDPPTLTLADLTPQQRRDWPPLAVGGAVHSDSPASRFIIVNGQIVREGEMAAPDVTVERIGPRAATLRWRDLRVELPY